MKFSVGRMPNLGLSISDATINIFDATLVGTQNADRVSNTTKAQYTLGGVTLVGTTVTDFSSNTNLIDSWELGASGSLFGFNTVSAFSRNVNTGVNTLLGGGSYTWRDLRLGGTYEKNQSSDDEITDTFNLVASYRFGDQVYKGGLQNVEDGIDMYQLEVAHNFTDSAGAYANTQFLSSGDNRYTVGFKYTF